jgi:hypothetical protein
MSKHHIYGPSSMKRRESCPASMQIEEKLKPLESEDAQEGLLIHKALEILDKLEPTLNEVYKKSDDLFKLWLGEMKEAQKKIEEELKE